MKQFSTLFYYVNGYFGSEQELIDIDATFDSTELHENFNDVYQWLEKSLFQPSQQAVDKILECSKTITC